MPTCTSCKETFTRVDNNGICRGCRTGDTDMSIISEELEEEFQNLPDLPENWFNEPIQNLNGGHILKILLLGNNKQSRNVEQLSERVSELENTNKINEPRITANTEIARTNGEKIEELERTITSMKKTIVNQQEFLEQLQRNNLAKNAMITGIPDTPLIINNNSIDEPEEKVKAILNELNPNLRNQDYSIRVFDSFTKHDGSITRSAKVTFTSIDTKKETLANSKTLKDKGDFFRSIYCKNDETKIARSENYRLRKKAKELRDEFPDDTIKIEKGVLKRNDVQVDKFDLNNQLFH